MAWCVLALSLAQTDVLTATKPAGWVQAPRVARQALSLRVAAYSTAPPEVQQQPGLTMEMALSITNATYMQLDKGLQGQHLDQIRVWNAPVAAAVPTVWLAHATVWCRSLRAPALHCLSGGRKC